MKTIITFLLFILSLNVFASENPITTSMWGSIPPSMAKPGDSIRFAQSPKGGSNLEYKFYYSMNGNSPILIKDWGPDKFADAVLPNTFVSIVFYGEVRGVGQPNSIYATQTYSFLKDIVLSSYTVNAGNLLTISHPSFLVGQSWTVNFTNLTGFSQSISGLVSTEGYLQVSVPNYEGKVSVFVSGIATRVRPLLTILPANGNTNPIANFGFSPAGGSAPLNLTLYGALSYLPGYENEPDRGIALCEWTVSTSTGDKNYLKSNNCITTILIQNAGTYQFTLKVTGINGATAILTQSYTVTPPLNVNPIAEFAVAPSSGQSPLTINVDATASYLPGWETFPNRGITDCTWTITRSSGDKKNYKNNSCVQSFTITEVGSHIVTLTAHGANGNNSSISKSVQVLPPQNNLAFTDFTLTPDHGNAPLAVQPDASLSFLQGHENQYGKGLASCQWSYVRNGTGDKKEIFLDECFTVGGLQFLLTEPGTYTITLVAHFVDGQVQTKTHTVNVTQAVQPIIDFSVTPDNGPVPLAGSADGRASYLPGYENTPDRGISSCVWSVTRSTGDKKRIVDNGCVTDFFINEIGVSNVTLEIHAINGTIATKTKTVNVTPVANQNPVADFSFTSDTGVAPFESEISAQLSFDPDGSIVLFSWNFGDGQTLQTTEPNVTHLYQTPGTYSVKLVVKDNLGAFSLIRTKTVTVTQASNLGNISGLTVKEFKGNVGDINVELHFTDKGTTYNTTSDADGRFVFNVPLDGNFTISSQSLGSYFAQSNGSLTASSNQIEIPLIMKKSGIGRISGRTTLSSNGSNAPGSKITLSFVDEKFERTTTADQTGNFSFENLPILGNFYLVANHGDTSSRRTFFGFLNSTVTEQNNINIGLGTPLNFPPFDNGDFALGNFNSWIEFGATDLVPMFSAFENSKTKVFPYIEKNTSKLPGLSIEGTCREPMRIPPRPNFKEPKLMKQKLEKNSVYAGVVANEGLSTTGGQLIQDITLDNDAELLVGRVRFLTNESLEDALVGYNDTFLVILSNPTTPVFIHNKDVKNIAWKTGTLGYRYSSDEFTFAIDVRAFAGQRVSFAFVVIDRGDLIGNSGIALSNVQLLKTSDRNFVETGSWDGSTQYTANLGDVTWFTVQNNGPLTALKISETEINQIPLILAHNQSQQIPSVTFKSTSGQRTFNINTLNPNDQIGFSVDTTLDRKVRGNI